jgi:hypothetical protein
MLKEAGLSIVPSLTRLINLSLTSKKYPSQWKKANVIPLFKKGARQLLNNYRPISLLSAVGKVLERIVFNYFCDNYLITLFQFGFMPGDSAVYLITVFQSGFMPGDSTVNQLVHLYHTFCEALDKKKEVRIVFCDISKAFDRVWHDGLAYKLKAMGIKGTLLEWFIDYLHDRKQRVVIKGQASEWGTIEAGVPQGSVLGPLLFLIYINDICNVVTSDIRLFADDTTLFITVDTPEHSAQILNNDLDSLKNWANQWLITFSPPKTTSMVCTWKRPKPEHPPLTFNNCQIDDVTHHKHLGVTLRSDLGWNNHLNDIVAKSSKRLDILCHLKYTLDRTTLEKLYFAYIRSILEYANILWDNCTAQEHELIEDVQKRAGRIVSGAIRGTSRQLIYDELDWDSLEERRKKNKLLFAYKMVNNHLPNYLLTLLPDRGAERAPNYNLRNSHLFTPVRCRTETYHTSLIPASVRAWNEADNTLKQATSLEVFRSSLFSKTDGRKGFNKQLLYSYGKRKISLIHARMRMKCSDLRGHLSDMNIIDDPSCHCGHPHEDNIHYLMVCPLHARKRTKLQNLVYQYTNFSVRTLLYGNFDLTLETNIEIFKAVHEFIEESNRFRV